MFEAAQQYANLSFRYMYTQVWPLGQSLQITQPSCRLKLASPGIPLV